MTISRLPPTFRCDRWAALLFISFIVVLLSAPPIALGAGAEDRQDGKSSAENKSGFFGIDWDNLDDWHQRISETIANPVERLDRFFGDERLDNEDRRSRLRTGIGLKYKQDGGVSIISDFNLRLALPHLEDRLHLFIDELVKEDEPDNLDGLESDDDSRPETGLRYIFVHNEQRSLNTDVGIRFSSSLQVFNRIRGRLIIPVQHWQLHLVQSVAWFTSDGWTETSEISWNRPLPDNYLFRATSKLTWEERTSGVTPAQTFILFKELDEDRGFRLMLSGRWTETPHTEEAAYTTRLSYRQRLHEQWLFFELAPGIEFRQTRDYEANPFLLGKLEVIFSTD